jgi:hypothetical protein
MTDEQYAFLIVQLSALAQLPGVFDGLDADQVRNLAWLLEETRERIREKLEEGQP